MTRKKGYWRTGTLAASLIAGTLLLLPARRAVAQVDSGNLTSDTYKTWIAQSMTAPVPFKPGDTVTAADAEKLRPFVPPGYLDIMAFPGFTTKVVPALDQTPAAAYTSCTEKYGAQVRIDSNGGLSNYRCGEPFPVSSFTANDALSGFKAGWDYYWRWLYRGFVDLQVDTVWLKPGNNHTLAGFTAPTNPPQIFTPDLTWTTPFSDLAEVEAAYQGGGLIQRYATLFYARVPFTHLADLDGGDIHVPGTSGVDFKNLTWFQSPFDIRGTAFIIFRYSDQNRADDAWAYIPNLRRLRRVSAEVKSDSLLGTDVTIDDFDGFNDRVLNWNWKFLGWANAFAVYDPTHYAHYFGPGGNVSNDVRSFRKQVVTIRYPKDPRHPYSSVINFWQPDSWSPSYQFCFDRRGKLWKVYEWEYKYSETFTPGFWAETMKGAHAPIWWHISCYDVQNHTSSLFRQEGPVMKAFSANELEAIFDLNALESVHR